MSLENPIDTWPPGPPEIPPLRPPERPAPKPILPSWLEPDPAGLDRDVADRLLEQRVIVVGGRLDDSVANRVAAQLLLLDARETDPITLHLACTDAELEASLALAGAVDLVESPVHAIARGTLRMSSADTFSGTATALGSVSAARFLVAAPLYWSLSAAGSQPASSARRRRCISASAVATLRAGLMSPASAESCSSSRVARASTAESRFSGLNS